MKRESLFTKLFALLLCVTMVVGCLPLSALAETNDWESEMDPADPIPGSAEAPIDLTNDLMYEGDMSATVTVPAGETYHYFAYRLGGMLMSINYGEAVECTTEGMMYPYNWTITNDGTEDAEYVITVNYPEGTVNNPQDLWAGETTTATLEANSQGWYFDFMAYENGYVTFTISGDSWQWQVLNNTTSVQSDLHTSVVAEGEEVVNSLTYKYTAEEDYQIMVNTFNPDDAWSTPAGDISITVEFTSGWGTEESPYQLTELENYVTIAAGETVHYYGYFSNMNMTVSGTENFVVTYNDVQYTDFWGSIDPIAVSSANPRMPIYFSVTNNNTEEAGYCITFAYPEGTMNNPQDLWEGSNEHTFAEGDGAWYYDYIGYSDGYLTFKISADCGWQYVINNNTAGVYGDMQWSDSEPVVTEQTFKYFAGEEYVMEVVTYNPADMWATPAGTINVEITFVAGFGTEESPYMLTEQQNDVTVADGDPVYYQGYFSGMNMTVTGEGDFSVIYNGETIAAVDGVVAIPVSSDNPRMPVTFAIDGSGDFSVDFTYPAGHMENPAVAVLGDNTASIDAGTQGYFWTYSADKDGDLIVTISGADNWTYCVNNMTSYQYGDTQWSDSDPVVNPTTITVAAGDQIQIIVNGYDPENPWTAPAAELTVNLAYAPEGPVVDETLKFNQKGIAFKDYVGLQFILSKTVASKYDSVYVDVVHSIWKDGEIVDTPVEIIPAEFSSAYRFEQEILAWSMNEQVSVTLYGEKDGVVYQGESFTTSVAALALEKIAAYDNAGNAKACTALVDMLNYGAAVQTGYSHNAESLPNANLGEYASMATAEDPTFAAENSESGEGSVAIYRHSVSMQSKVEMQVIFNVDVSAYELRYTVNGVTTTIPSSEFTVTKFTKVAIGIPASNMRAEYQIALYDPATGEAVTPIMTRTVEAYAKAALGGTYNDVVIAMLKYGDSIAAL